MKRWSAKFGRFLQPMRMSGNAPNNIYRARILYIVHEIISLAAKLCPLSRRLRLVERAQFLRDVARLYRF